MTPSPLADPDEHDSSIGAAYEPAWVTGGDGDLDEIVEKWSNGANLTSATSIAATVERATATIDALRHELEEASIWVDRASTFAAKEAELGRLIMRAQEFAARSASQAEERSRQVIAEAEVEAAIILEAARVQSAAIIEEAQRAPSLPPDDAHRLQEALQLFARTNGDLMRELRLLSEALAPRGDPEAGEPEA